MAKAAFKVDARRFALGIRRNLNNLGAKETEALRRIGEYVAREAKDRAPIDEGKLTQDITFSVAEDNGVKAAVIHIPANAPSASYAVRTHEGEYELGPGSQAKQDRVGKQVGRKYITRAIDDNLPEIRNIAEEALKV